jgi:hypothetical protein
MGWADSDGRQLIRQTLDGPGFSEIPGLASGRARRVSEAKAREKNHGIAVVRVDAEQVETAGKCRAETGAQPDDR